MGINNSNNKKIKKNSEQALSEAGKIILYEGGGKWKEDWSGGGGG